MKQVVDINCDMGEGFGSWTIGNDVDAAMVDYISSANVAAGFHAGDPSTMRHTVRRAREAGVGVGVHPGFRDLVGFGRRHIAADADELVADCLYQLGALREIARSERVDLQHLKLHGALYMHAAKDEEFATALVDALQHDHADLPVLVMGGTVIDRVARDRGQPVVRELFADRHYGDDGLIVFTRGVGALDPGQVAAKVLRACTDGRVESVNGSVAKIEFESICIHSDTPGALDLMTATYEALRGEGIAIRSFARA